MSKTKLTPDQLEAFGAEMDALRQRIIADLGEEDAAYIRNVVKRQRQFEIAGRALFYLPPAWPLAVAALSVSKILDNMEIGHNVMHGQYDWTRDPALNSKRFEWDTACPTIGKPIRIHAVVRNEGGRTWVDFSPELRFAPSADPSRWVWM